MKTSINDEKLKDKFDEADKKKIEDVANDGIKYCDDEHETEDYKVKKKELEDVASPIMSKLYQSSECGPGGCPINPDMPSNNTSENESSDGPKIEEVD